LLPPLDCFGSAFFEEHSWSSFLTFSRRGLSSPFFALFALFQKLFFSSLFCTPRGTFSLICASPPSSLVSFRAFLLFFRAPSRLSFYLSFLFFGRSGSLHFLSAEPSRPVVCPIPSPPLFGRCYAFFFSRSVPIRLEPFSGDGRPRSRLVSLFACFPHPFFPLRPSLCLLSFLGPVMALLRPVTSFFFLCLPPVYLSRLPVVLLVTTGALCKPLLYCDLPHPFDSVRFLITQPLFCKGCRSSLDRFFFGILFGLLVLGGCVHGVEMKPHV